MIINAFRRVAGGRQPTTQLTRSIRSYTTEQPLAGEAKIRQKLTESFKPIRLQVEDVSGTYLLKYRYSLITFFRWMRLFLRHQYRFGLIQGSYDCQATSSS